VYFLEYFIWHGRFWCCWSSFHFADLGNSDCLVHFLLVRVQWPMMSWDLMCFLLLHVAARIFQMLSPALLVRFWGLLLFSPCPCAGSCSSRTWCYISFRQSVLAGTLWMAVYLQLPLLLPLLFWYIAQLKVHVHFLMWCLGLYPSLITRSWCTRKRHLLVCYMFRNLLPCMSKWIVL